MEGQRICTIGKCTKYANKFRNFFPTLKSFQISKWRRPKLRKVIVKRCKAEFLLYASIFANNMDTFKRLGDSLESTDMSTFKAIVRLLGELYNCHALSNKKIMNCVDVVLRKYIHI